MFLKETERNTFIKDTMRDHSVLQLTESWLQILVSNGYTTVCLPVQGDNPQGFVSDPFFKACGLYPVQSDKPWITVLYPPHQYRHC